MGRNGAQPAVPSSMRETLGAPGRWAAAAGQGVCAHGDEDGIADVKLGQLAIQKGGRM